MQIPPAESALTPGTSSEGLSFRYEALIRLAAVLRSHPEEKDLFQTFAKELHQVVPFDGMAHFDAAGNWVQWFFLEPYSKESVERAIPREETIAWWVYQNQQPVFMRLTDGNTRFPSAVKWLASFGLRSLCALPLSTAHRQLGSLVFTSHLDDGYTSGDRQFLSLVADQIAIAIDDARTQERLRLLLDLTNRVVTKLDLHDLLQEVSRSIRQVMHCDSVGVVLPDPENGELYLYAGDFSGHQEIAESTRASDAAEHVFRTGQHTNLTKEQIAAIPILAEIGTKSAHLWPLVSRERELGVLGLGSARENAFTEDDLAFLGQVANQIALAVENALSYQQICQLKDKLLRENVYLESEIRSELGFEEIVGKSEILRRALKEVETVAPADSTVLIWGESGTGKELIARALHNLSARKANAFVKLNCAAIPTGLMESELFGHEKGAFTGAIAQRVGRFELANRGTIFLDEIGEIPLELQPKLLRVLQEREFERLGSTRTLRTDARLIAATNRDLKTMVEEHTFRSDLYYRLNVFPIRMPALRERKEDIPLLVRHFVQELSRRNNRMIDTIPSETMEALGRYHWPGNIRELQNVIERAVIITKGPVLNVPLAELSADDSTKTSPASPKLGSAYGESLRDMLADTERAQILRALEEAHGVIAGPNGAAARLGMKRSTLQLRMQKLGIRLSRTAVDESRRTVQ